MGDIHGNAAAGSLRRLTTGMIARMCKVATRTVAKWCDSGKLKCHRLPPGSDSPHTMGDRRVFEDDLIEFCRAYGIPCDLDRERVVLLAVRAGLLPIANELRSQGRLAIAAADIFEVATELINQRPRVVALDFAFLGRSECLSLAAKIRRSSSQVYLVALPCDDEVESAHLSTLFDQVLYPPHDIAKLALILLGNRRAL